MVNNVYLEAVLAFRCSFPSLYSEVALQWDIAFTIACDKTIPSPFVDLL